MTLEQVRGGHAPTSSCAGCREIFDDGLGLNWGTEERSALALALFSSIEHLQGYTAMRLRRSPERLQATLDALGAKVDRGQAIVEFALLVPFLAFVALAGLDSARLFVDKFSQDRLTAEAATWYGGHPLEDPGTEAAFSELLPGCEVWASEVEPSLVRVASRCTWEPMGLHGLWAGLVISSEAKAVRTG